MTDDTAPSQGSTTPKPGTPAQLAARERFRAYSQWLKSNPSAKTTPAPNVPKAPAPDRDTLPTETLETPATPAKAPKTGQTTTPEPPKPSAGRFLIFDRSDKPESLFRIPSLKLPPVNPGTPGAGGSSFFDRILKGSK
jgi:hypothetical protein